MAAAKYNTRAYRLAKKTWRPKVDAGGPTRAPKAVPLTCETCFRTSGTKRCEPGPHETSAASAEGESGLRHVMP